jgi:hypothetical protein
MFNNTEILSEYDKKIITDSYNFCDNIFDTIKFIKPIFKDSINPNHYIFLGYLEYSRKNRIENGLIFSN